jgi:FkbM family methyltransferase
MLNVIAQYQLGHGKFDVPLWQIPWDLWDVEHYEAAFVEAFCRAVTRMRDVTFLDCGADIGTFSVLISSRTERIGRIIAFEPNFSTHEFLQANLSSLGIPFAVVPKAVSYFEGRGYLESPEENLTDHARFLVAGDGPIEVITIDSMKLFDRDIAIKLDLEGGELQALQGAKETIALARHCVIGLEASPAVGKRTGCDPVECLRFLESLRPFHFLIAETGERPSTSVPILRDGQSQIWNIVAWTDDHHLM